MSKQRRIQSEGGSFDRARCGQNFAKFTPVKNLKYTPAIY